MVYSFYWLYQESSELRKYRKGQRLDKNVCNAWFSLSSIKIIKIESDEWTNCNGWNNTFDGILDDQSCGILGGLYVSQIWW